MQHIGIRVGTATDLAKAAEFTLDVASYARESLGWDLRIGVNQTGPADQIAIFSRNDSLDELLTRRASVLTDPGMVERMSKLPDLFVPGSSESYIVRPLFGSVEATDKELIYFRAVNLVPNALGQVVGTCEQICNRLINEHDMDVTCGAIIGGAGDTLLWGVRFASGDGIETGFEATMADETYNKLVAATTEHTASVQDRIVRLLPR